MGVDVAREADHVVAGVGLERRCAVRVAVEQQVGGEARVERLDGDLVAAAAGLGSSARSDGLRKLKLLFVPAPLKKLKPRNVTSRWPAMPASSTMSSSKTVPSMTRSTSLPVRTVKLSMPA